MSNHPFVVDHEEGHAFAFLGTLMTVKAASVDTGGQFSLIEQLAPPGFATPLHVHYGEDEAMFIIEGSCTFFIGDQVLRAGRVCLLAESGSACVSCRGRSTDTADPAHHAGWC